MLHSSRHVHENPVSAHTRQTNPPNLHPPVEALCQHVQPHAPQVPHPPRLKESMSERILKWLMIMADSEGVGLKSEQLTTAAAGGFWAKSSVSLAECPGGQCQPRRMLQTSIKQPA